MPSQQGPPSTSKKEINAIIREESTVDPGYDAKSSRIPKLTLQLIYWPLWVPFVSPRVEPSSGSNGQFKIRLIKSQQDSLKSTANLGVSPDRFKISTYDKNYDALELQYKDVYESRAIPEWAYKYSRSVEECLIFE